METTCVPVLYVFLHLLATEDRKIIYIYIYFAFGSKEHIKHEKKSLSFIETQNMIEMKFAGLNMDPSTGLSSTQLSKIPEGAQ